MGPHVSPAGWLLNNATAALFVQFWEFGSTDLAGHPLDVSRRAPFSRQLTVPEVSLWRDPEPTYHGRFVDFERAKSYPKPVQAGGVPIAVGGHTEAAARRAGRLGDEFFPGVVGGDQLGGLIGVMREAAKKAGRDPDSIGITAGGAMDPDGVKRLADEGITRVVVPNLGGSPETWKSMLGAFSDNFISKVG